MRLEPLAPRHVADLTRSAAEERSTYDYTVVPDGATAMAAYVDALVADRDAGSAVPFAQVRAADGVAIGATRLWSFRFRPGAELPCSVEIGGTWLAASAQRTGINTEAKLLLFTHAFETWNVERVELRTDARNTRSRDAIAGVGAAFEGVLRKWQPSHVVGEGRLLRDSAMFSVLDTEWPQVARDLRARLSP